MHYRIRQRTEHLAKHLGQKLPANGLSTLTQGAVANADLGDLFHMGGECTGHGHDVIYPRHKPLPSTQRGGSTAARAFAGENLLAARRANQSGEGLLKITGKQCLGQICDRHPLI